MSDDPSQPDVTAEDALDVGQQALQQLNDLREEVHAQQERIDELETEVATLELRHSGRPDDRDYESLTLDEKVGMVREHAFKRATNSKGRAKLDYNDIRWSVFDSAPSTKHCYKLLRLAGEARGFEYQDDASPKRLVVNADEAKASMAFFPGNKTGEEEVAE
jgi:hypothetical protein